MLGILDLALPALVQLCAAKGRFMRVAVPNTCQNSKIIKGPTG
jgi:hypothetical protein